MPSLSKYLNKELFAGISVAEAAQKTGVDPSFMSKILRGRATPSFDNIFRIAYATGSDPVRLFELAGYAEMAMLCRGINWPSHQGNLTERDLYPARAAELHRRLQRLVELGFADQADTALRSLEAAWELLRPAFEAFAQGTGAKAAALIADTPSRPGDVLFTWKCPDPKARHLARTRKEKGWKAYTHKAKSGQLTLFLREPAASTAKSARTALTLWASSLFRLSGSSAAEADEAR